MHKLLKCCDHNLGKHCKWILVIQQTTVNYLLLGIYIFVKYFDNKVKMNVMDYYYWIIKILGGIRTEVVVKRVVADPQGEMKNDKSCWVRTQVMQEASSPKSDQDSLWFPKEKQVDKWVSPRKNIIQSKINKLRIVKCITYTSPQE